MCSRIQLYTAIVRRVNDRTLYYSHILRASSARVESLCFKPRKGQWNIHALFDGRGWVVWFRHRQLGREMRSINNQTLVSPLDFPAFAEGRETLEAALRATALQLLENCLGHMTPETAARYACHLWRLANAVTVEPTVEMPWNGDEQWQDWLCIEDIEQWLQIADAEGVQSNEWLREMARRNNVAV